MSPEAVVARAFGCMPSQVNDATSAGDLAQWDSLGHVTLIIELESAYGVSFAPEEAMTMTNVGEIKRALRARGTTW